MRLEVRYKFFNTEEFTTLFKPVLLLVKDGETARECEKNVECEKGAGVRLKMVRV